MEVRNSNGLQVFSLDDGGKDDTVYKVSNIFVKGGIHIHKKRRICVLTSDDDSKEAIIIKSKYIGIVKKMFIRKNSDVKIGSTLLEIEECTHPTLLGNLCCDCGTVIEDKKPLTFENSDQAHVSMLHSIPDLKVSRQEAKRLGLEDISNLLNNKKLVLLVDLDQTLVHTTNDNIPPKLKDVYHFQLACHGPWYHTRIRPFTEKFLEKISKLYELHICTFGVREYAHHIAHFLDGDQKLFGQRILSRNECLDPMSKKANLSSLFPCGDNLVCIIDDRSDVWNFAPNVVQVLPYHFFQHTGDINAPIGLQKKENDNTRGFDFTKIESTLNQTLKDDDQKSLTSSSKDFDDDKSQETKEKDSQVDTDSKFCQKCKSERRTLENNATICEKCDDSSLGKISESDGRTTNSSCSSSNEDENDPIANLENSPCKSILKAKLTEDHGDDSLNISITDSLGDDVRVTLNEESGFIEVPDTDDYLLYLEDILINLHARFYHLYDKQESSSVTKIDDVLQHLPDLKAIVPFMRKEVLKGVNIVFSGIFPHHVKLENSKPYHIALSLGATISKSIAYHSSKNRKKFQRTTHVVAANPHTEKVRQAKRIKHIKIVSPNWLWCCAERWERVDERLFQLTKNSEGEIQRNPPMHCYINPPSKNEFVEALATEQQQFVEKLNPLAFMTNDEAKSMEEEVDIVLSDEDEEDEKRPESLQGKECPASTSSSSEVSLGELSTTDDDEVQKPRQKRPRSITEDENGGDSDDELPSVKFRQGGALPSDQSAMESDDEDLNAYGDILARELLG